MLRKNFEVNKDRRRREAAERQQVRVARGLSEQEGILDRRPGESRRERARLAGML